MVAKARSSFCLLVPAAAVLLVLSFIIIRVERDAVSFLRTGDSYFRRGETAEAFFYWKLAVSMYVPCSPTPPRAAERLLAAADQAAARGDAQEAARAFGYLRSALLSIRHVRQPLPEYLSRAESGLAAWFPGVDRTEHAALLAHRDIVSTVSLPFLIAGGAGWPVSVMLALRHRGRGGRFRAWQLALPTLFLALLTAGILLA